MSARCKPGDLAVYVGDLTPIIGQITRCVRQVDCGCGKVAWEIDPPLHFSFLAMPVCHDENLKPIRDGEGQDETLSWAKVPDGEVTV